MRVAISIGTRFPAYAISMGRVLLAAQPDDWRREYLRTAHIEALTPWTVTDRVKLAALLATVAKQGYALVDQELEQGLRSLAVPLHDKAGTVVAAINIQHLPCAAVRSRSGGRCCRLCWRPPR